MVDLKIRVIGDATSGVAAVHQLSAEEAKLLLAEKQANAQRIAEARKVAHERVDTARKGHILTQDSVNALRKTEREWAAESKKANQEAAAARREAARIDRQELRAQLAAAKQLEAAKLAAAKQEKQRAQDAERMAIDALRSDIEDRARNNRKLAGGPKKSDPDFFEGTEGYGAAFIKRAVGPAAIIGALTGVMSQFAQLIAELKEIRQSMAAQTVKTGERSLSLSDKLRKGGMKDEGIQQVLQKVQFRAGAMSTDDLADIAERGVTEGHGGNVSALMRYIEQQAGQRERGTTPEEQAALRDRRVKRQAEIRKGLSGRDLATRKSNEDVAVLERQLFMDENDGGSLLHRMAANVDVFNAEYLGWNDDDMKAAGGREQYFNQQYNMRASRNGGGQVITVRIDPESLAQMTPKPVGDH